MSANAWINAGYPDLHVIVQQMELICAEGFLSSEWPDCVSLPSAELPSHKMLLVGANADHKPKSRSSSVCIGLADEACCASRSVRETGRQPTLA